MRIIDISGPIYEDMWNYGGESKPFRLGSINMKFGRLVYPIVTLENMQTQTGTFFETGGSILGYTIDDIPIEKLFMINTYVLQIPYDMLEIVDDRPCIFKEDLKKAEKEEIPKKSGIIISTGYGKNWEKKDYLQKCPFLKKESVDYLIEKKPFIVVLDTPFADNDVHPEDAFTNYFKANIFNISACINLEKIKKYNVKLIVMPLRILKVAAACPARAFVIEE